MSDTATPKLTRLPPSIGTVPRTSHGHWFRGRQTPELLLYYIPGTMMPRPTYAGIYSRNTTQRLSPPTTALSVNVSSFVNGIPETGSHIHRQKQQPLYSVGSRLAPLTRRVANESSPFGLGISHRPRSGPLQRDRTTLPRPPLQRDRFPPDNLCPGPLHCRRGAPAESPMPFSTPKCYQKAALLRTPPIPPIPLPTTCTLLTTRDLAEPLCPGSRLSRRRSPPGDVPYGLEDSNHSLHLVGLAFSNSSPIYPRHRRPSGDSSRPSPHGLVNYPFDKRWRPYRPLFHGYPGPNHPAFDRPPMVPPGQLFSLPTSVPRPTTTFPSFPTTTNPRLIAPYPAL